MPEHLIRLRGPWQLWDSVDRPEGPSRIVLPIDSLPSSSGPIRLQRHFGRPARSAESVSCRLRCRDVPGLRSIRLNDELLAEPSPADLGPTASIEVPIPGSLLQRNILELVVDPGQARSFPSTSPWGSVCLVFNPDESRDPIG